jgi:hypothetical protein
VRKRKIFNEYSRTELSKALLQIEELMYEYKISIYYAGELRIKIMNDDYIIQGGEFPRMVEEDKLVLIENDR